MAPTYKASSVGSSWPSQWRALCLEARIDTAEAVDVSYPGFFQEMAKLGANVRVE